MTTIHPGDIDTMSSLEEEARKRKERLAALRNTLGPGAGTGTASPAQPAAPPDEPREPESRKRAASPSAEGQQSEAPQRLTLEQEAEAFAKEALTQDATKKAEVDLVDLAPKKPNWDLKRDLEQKLAKLERRTDLAIAQIIRQRLKDEGNTEDTAALEGADRMERNAEEGD